MNIDEFKQHIASAAQCGKLLTPKHDPASLGTTGYSSYRSVLTPDLANQLDEFMASGDYSATLYENTRSPQSPDYVVLVPGSSSTFSVPGSGVPPGSPQPTQPLDCIVAVSGQDQGWHVFCETLASVAEKRNAGTLVRGVELIEAPAPATPREPMRRASRSTSAILDDEHAEHPDHPGQTSHRGDPASPPPAG